MFPCWADGKQINLQINNTEAVCTCFERRQVRKYTLPETNSKQQSPLKLGRIPKGKAKVFQLSIFRCKLLGSGRIILGLLLVGPKNPNSATLRMYFFSLKLIGSKHLTIRWITESLVRAVDGRNLANQLIGTVVYPIIYKGLYIPGGCLGFLPSTICSLVSGEGILPQFSSRHRGPCPLPWNDEKSQGPRGKNSRVEKFPTQGGRQKDHQNTWVSWFWVQFAQHLFVEIFVIYVVIIRFLQQRKKKALGLLKVEIYPEIKKKLNPYSLLYKWLFLQELWKLKLILQGTDTYPTFAKGKTIFQPCCGKGYVSLPPPPKKKDHFGD